MAEYIWHCPRRCGAIITKTSKSQLNRDQIYQCRHCNEKYRGDTLMILNKKNIERELRKSNNENKA